MKNVVIYCMCECLCLNVQGSMKLVTGAVCLLAVLAQGLNIDELERLVAVTLTVGQTVSRLNIMCNVTPVEFKCLLGRHNLVIRSSKESSNDETVLFCADEKRPLEFARAVNGSAVKNVWIVAGTTESLAKIVNGTKIQINQQVAFFNTETEVSEECYHVNNGTICNVLDGNINIFSRNSLEGIQLRGGLDSHYDPFTVYPQEPLQDLQWVENERGAFVADASHIEPKGIFVEVMNILERDLNFTTKKYLRKDDVVGYPIVKNRTIVGFSGRIGDLLAGDLDILIYPSLHTLDKYGFLSFMHGLGSVTTGLFVSKEAGNEEEEWLMYLLPFRPRVWLLLVMNALVALMSLRILSFRYASQCSSFISSVKVILGDLWMVFFSYFGSISPAHYGWSISYTQKLLLVMCLSGNLVFMAYKSALTSNLSVRKYSLPFKTVEEFYWSDYR